ncbi:MAG: cyclic nucleotide-binding domain-containing protein [Planctomycetes bacterium]|nr:cyclic nucleotide-binding domain-containing protein [Planctomycetota bacterium]
MNEFLEFLTDEDRRLLSETAEHRRYAPDEVILAEGAQRNALFVIQEGSARVERAHMEFSLEVARLGAGELFGDMGFIEGLPASASIVAEEPTEIEIIDVAHVRKLIERDAGFYGRFYQSLAKILSRRLRETTVQTIADYSWGGDAFDTSVPDLEGGWSGGSPLRGD